MKKIILILLLFTATNTSAQKEIRNTKGQVDFEASVPLFEEVKATNETAVCILNTKNGEITSVVPITAFRFKLSLMQTHFNEKYLESDHYPQATFKGKIMGFNWNIIGSATKEFKMKGKLEIHGKTREINTIVLLNKTENGLNLTSNFSLNLRDYAIEIPEILSMKIAEKVNVKTLFLF